MSYTYCHALSLHDALPMSHAQIDLHVRVRIRAGSIVDRDRRIRLDAVRGLGRRQRNLAHRHADAVAAADIDLVTRSDAHTSELQSLMRIWYAVFCLKKKNTHRHEHNPLAYYTT